MTPTEGLLIAGLAYLGFRALSAPGKAEDVSGGKLEALLGLNIPGIDLSMPKLDIDIAADLGAGLARITEGWSLGLGDALSEATDNLGQGLAGALSDLSERARIDIGVDWTPPYIDWSLLEDFKIPPAGEAAEAVVGAIADTAGDLARGAYTAIGERAAHDVQAIGEHAAHDVQAMTDFMTYPGKRLASAVQEAAQLIEGLPVPEKTFFEEPILH